MKGMLKLSYFVSILIMVLACEEAIEWDLDPEVNGTLAVEAIITNENRIQTLRLSESFSKLTGTAKPVADATVLITDQGETYPFLPHPSDPGLFLSQMEFAARKDIVYTLFVRWNNQNYFGHNILSIVSPLEPIRFDTSKSQDSISIIEVAPQYHPWEQAMHEVLVYWRHIDPSPSSLVKMYYYTFNTVDGSELFKPAEEKVFFPSGSLVVRKKFGLTDDFAKYLRSLVLETRWQGGYFDEDPASLPSNISNGGLGYFSVCAVLSDTLIVE